MRVGTRLAKKSLDAYAEDHPHACGDKQYSYSDPLVAKGSSPCVWGQGFKKPSHLGAHRIIPMRVGTSDRVTHRIDKWEDHPHACGDKKSVAQALLSVTGSSPCVWGQADRIFNCNFVTGIIPMRVGTSRYPQLRITAVGDHPHACGDKISLM